MSDAARLVTFILSLVTFASAMIIVGRTMQRMNDLERRFDQHCEWADKERDSIKGELSNIYARKDMVTLELEAIKSRLDYMSGQLGVLTERRLKGRHDDGG